MYAGTERLVYIDVGTSMVKTTHLLTDSDYFLDPMKSISGPKLITFPRFALGRVQYAETEKDLKDSVDAAMVEMYKAKSKESFSDLFSGKIKTFEQTQIMQLMYNMMSNFGGNNESFLPLVLTEKLIKSKKKALKKRSKIIEYAFEELHIPSLYLTSTPALISYSELKETTVVVELSESTSQVVCIKDGFPLRQFIGEYERTGIDLTERYIKLLKNNSSDEISPIVRVMALLIRDGLCKADQFSDMIGEDKDGKKLDDALIQTYLGEESPIVDTIIKTVENVLKKIGSETNIFDSIIIAGNVASVGSLDTKIIYNLNDVNNKLLSNLNPKKSSHRHLASIVGARIMAAVPGFAQSMVSRTSYYENGASYISATIV